jgi:Ceramidase
MTDYIDIYCERLAPGLWAEPMNAVTNGSFFIAAFFLFFLMKREGCKDRGALLLASLVLCIGIGSSLFHTFATPWAQMADVLPILFFQMTFIWLYASRAMKWGLVKSALLFVCFIAASAGFESLPAEMMNGSMGYVPALMFVAGFGVWHFLNAAHERWILLAAAGVFVVSLALRSVDMAVCESFALGTHFLWHSLNGVVLYLSTRAYIRAAVSV